MKNIKTLLTVSAIAATLCAGSTLAATQAVGTGTNQTVQQQDTKLKNKKPTKSDDKQTGSAHKTAFDKNGDAKANDAKNVTGDQKGKKHKKCNKNKMSNKTETDRS